MKRVKGMFTEESARSFLYKLFEECPTNNLEEYAIGARRGTWWAAISFPLGGSLITIGMNIFGNEIVKAFSLLVSIISVLFFLIVLILTHPFFHRINLDKPVKNGNVTWYFLVLWYKVRGTSEYSAFVKAFAEARKSRMGKEMEITWIVVCKKAGIYAEK